MEDLALVLCLFLSTVALTHMGQGVYYVKPTPEDRCSQQPCDTLSGYVENIDLFRNDSSKNVTMMFLPGTHTISRTWTIMNMCNLSLQGPTGIQSNISARIECTSQTFLRFSEILMIKVESLSISHCYYAVLTRNLHTLWITNSNFSENAQAIAASRVQQVIVDNSILVRNSYSKYGGGALSLTAIEKVQIQNSIFANNRGSGLGGAIYMYGIHIIYIANCSFVNNLAYKGNCEIPSDCSTGGGISIFGYTGGAYVYPGVYPEVVFDGLILFENNSAQGKGGGLYAQHVTSVSFLGKTHFYNNSAYWWGGALVVRTGCNLTIFTSIFRNNRCTNVGGATLVSYMAFFRCRNCTFIENYVTGANNSRGGGLAIVGLEEGSNEHSARTAVVKKHSNRTVVENSDMPDDHFNSSGGKLLNGDVTGQCSPNSFNTMKVVFEGLTLFKYNQVKGDGGALIAMDVVVEFLGKTILQNNSATNTGGGIKLLSSKALFKNDTYIGYNIAEVNGGGISSWDSTVSFQEDTHIRHNIAKVNGGGILSEKSVLSFHGKNTNFFHNSASSYNGGGLNAVLSNLNFKGAVITFHNNQAQYQGGGIGGSGITLTMNAEEVSFTNNTALHGGALYTVRILESIMMNEVEITCTGIIQFVNNYAGQTGGGLSLQYTRLLISSVITINNNEAFYKGGWLYANQGTVTILGELKAELNTAEGGAVISAKGVTLILQANQMVFENNGARAGGVMFIESSELHLVSNFSFIRNTARYYGGALFLGSSSHILLYENSNTFFSFNHADTGGAIYQDDYSYVDTR